MSTLKIATKLLAMAGNGELDKFVPVLELFVTTLYNYPVRGHMKSTTHSTPFPSAEELQAFLENDEKIRLSLVHVIALVAQLPIWESVAEELGREGVPETDAADIAEDTRAGFDAWLCDQRAFVELVPDYNKEIASTASQVASLALEAVGASPIPPAGAEKREPSPSSAPGEAGLCFACGSPATGELFGFKLCDSCAAVTQQQIAGVVGGKP